MCRCDFRSHVYKYEAGGIAFHSQASTTSSSSSSLSLLPNSFGLIPSTVLDVHSAMLPENGHHLTWEDDVEPNLVLGDDVHSCPTKIVSLEVTLLFEAGQQLSLSAHR